MKTFAQITVEELRSQYAYYLRSAGELSTPQIQSEIQRAASYTKEQFRANSLFVSFLRYARVLR